MTAALLCLAALRSGAGAAAAWWLFNDQPPALEAVAPGGPLGGPLQVQVTVRSPGPAQLATVTLDGRALPLPAPPRDPAASGAWPFSRLARAASGSEGTAGVWAATVDIDTATLPDGDHTLSIAAVDGSRRHNRSMAQVTFTSDNTPPQLTLEAVPARLRAGRPAMVRLSVNEPAQVQVTWGTEPVVNLTPGDGASGAGRQDGDALAPGRGLVSFVAVPVNADAGQVTLHVAGHDTAGNAAETTVPVVVDPVALPRQALDVPPELAPLATGPVASAEAAQLAAMTSTVRPERLWTGEFRAPLPAAFPRTTGFGDRRDYADGYVTYHAGYDIAAPLGTPVPVAAGGVVLFAGQLAQRGNAVVVDHGWGVFTVYAHLSRFEVQAGQAVAQGQPVGLVGTTGLSTGPHLHWEVRIRGLPVDPASWIALSHDLE